MALVIVLIIGTILCCVYFSRGYSKGFSKGHREHYGGAVKRIHRIPKNTCYSLCGQYYRRCMSEFQYVDAGDCGRRYNNCLAVCDYSNFQRL